MQTRTSENSPLRIAAVTPGDGQGGIGITLCPGKTDPAAMSGPVARNLPTDLDAIRDWGPPRWSASSPTRRSRTSG